MALHVFERPVPPPETLGIAQDIASRTGLPEAEISRVLDQEMFYIRGHGSVEGGVARLQAEDEVNWIAERLRIKRNRVRVVLEAYSDCLRERGLIPPPMV